MSTARRDFDVSAGRVPRHTRPASQPTATQVDLLRARYRPALGRGSPVNRGLAGELGVSAWQMRQWAVTLGLNVPYRAAPSAARPPAPMLMPVGDRLAASDQEPLDDDGQPILSQELKHRIKARVREIAGEAAIEIAREQAREVVRDFLWQELPEIVQKAVDEAATRVARTTIRELLTAVVSAAVE